MQIIAKLDRAAALTVASVLAAWVFVLTDATQRSFGNASVSRHVAASFALYTVAGAAVGLAASAIAYLAQALAKRLENRYPRFAAFAGPAVYAAVASLASSGTAFWTFSGARVRATLLGNVGPWLFVLGIALTVAALAGVGVSAAYTLPDSMFADVIEWDELRTRRRQEGIFYGIRNLIRKLTGALVIFTTLQLLGRSGYASPPEGTLQFTQTDSALQTIRLLVSPFGATILCGAILLAWLFPLSREKYTRIQKLLEQRRARLAE